MGSVLSQLAMFMPWIETLTQILSLGQKSLIGEKVEAYEETYQFMKDRIEERKQTWVKGQPRDITDAYLDKVDETEDIDSSFHRSRKFKIIRLVLAPSR